MKIAIIGGGSAGFLAAAHISHFFPQHDLYQIYDPGTQPIGVGEGTLPFFVHWINQITGLPFTELARLCDATYKHGVQFEDWGKTNRQFAHLFGHGKHAYHISAHKLSLLLKNNINGKVYAHRVTMISKEGQQARLTFDDHTELLMDFVFDARGFPLPLDQNQTLLPEIPTNAALITRGPVIESVGLTWAVARPHGWIFMIPLANRSSYGYIYNEDLTTGEDVHEDFSAFLKQKEITTKAGRRLIRFPSFMQNTFFDGVIFRIGNRAAFLEPLEATAIGITLEQIKIASYWLAGAYLNDPSGGPDNNAIIKAINEQLQNIVRSVSMFVSWHYAQGSACDTAFWDHARACFQKGYHQLAGSAVRSSFDKMIMAGKQIPPDSFPVMSALQTGSPTGDSNQPSAYFGGFTDLSFAQIGHGIGNFLNI